MMAAICARPYGLDGLAHGTNAGICFEAQNFPDAINQNGFPSPILRPGRSYHQVTEYRFEIGGADAFQPPIPPIAADPATG